MYEQLSTTSFPYMRQQTACSVCVGEGGARRLVCTLSERRSGSIIYIIIALHVSMSVCVCVCVYVCVCEDKLLQDRWADWL